MDIWSITKTTLQSNCMFGLDCFGSDEMPLDSSRGYD